jgi:hypothetical protein
MQGTSIAGWTVREVLVADGDVRRYAVVNADGRAGTLEIAAAGTGPAAAFVARTRALAPHEVLDRGIDGFGNPYVVLPVASAPIPPPPPAQFIPPPPQLMPPPPPSLQAPPRIAHSPPPPPPPQQPPVTVRIAAAPSRAPRAGRRKWIAIGVIVAGAVAIFMANRTGKRRHGSGDFTVKATGQWGPLCSDPYRIDVEASTDANVTIAGHRATTDGMRHAFIQLAERELGDKKTLPVQATSFDRDEAETTVTIVPRGAGAGSLSEGVYLDKALSAATVMLHDSTGAHEVRISSADTARPSTNQLGFEWTACRVKPATVQKPGVTATLDGKKLHVEIAVDTNDLEWRTAATASGAVVDASVALEGEDGRPLELTIHAVEKTRTDKFPRLANIAKQPIPSAPLPADVPVPRPIAVVTSDGSLEQKYLGGKAPADAPYVAIVQYDSSNIGGCGPYGDVYRQVYAPRTRATIRAKVFEARTGKLVAQRAFNGAIPACPHTISVSLYSNSADTISGDYPTDAFDNWLAKFQI